MPKKKKRTPKKKTEEEKSPLSKETKMVSTIEPRSITEELQESYLDYAMSVIVSRALPDIRDGLKPVHRRILWAMWDMGLTPTARFVKSARVVGEVLGKYHPHGDTAVYDSMVRMAQDFSLRYPLIKGQGNFGNIDGDNAAAQRYTEARLSKISEGLMRDIEKDTVEWRPNYDNTREEPKFLPAKLPNLLLNGTMGIAVGMATNIPPHNLNEVADAAICLIKNPKAELRDIMNFIPGPDFPTGGIIYGKKSIEEAYATGRGSITLRGVTDIEEKKGSYAIVISEIPYQVVKADMVTKIASLVQDKKIEGIKDVRDESDRDGLRVVIDLKQSANPDRILNQLFKHTDLQKNFYFNMLALVDGIQPQTVSLKDILSAYVEHRKIVVRRRVEFNLRKAEERAHILEGLAKALKFIDRVIATIKKSKDKEDAHKNLVNKFKLTKIQADAILEMRLQTLAALETEKINNELKEKKKLIVEFKDILDHPKKILAIIIKELEELKKEFGDERRTRLVTRQVQEFNQEDFIPKEETVVILTRDGYIKRVSPSSFKVQRRGGRGLIGFDLKEEDSLDKLISTNTHDHILFFTDRGKVFRTRVNDVPAAKRTAKGKLVHTFLGMHQDEKVTAFVSYPASLEKSTNENGNPSPEFLLMATDKGLVKKTPLSDFENVRRNGIIAINLKSDDVLRWARLVSSGDEVFIATKNGQAIRFKEKDARPMGRTAAGVRAINLKKNDLIAGVAIIKKGVDLNKERVLIVTALGYGKQTPISKYKIQRRGGGGIQTSRVTEKTGPVAAAMLVNDSVEGVMALSAKGNVIKMLLKNIRLSGRSTQGVRIMKLDKGDEVVGVVCL